MDGQQQLTPEQFITMIGNLELSSEQSDSSVFINRMSELREDVDELDSQVLELIGKRMDIVREMGHLKSEQKVSTLQPHRWQEILDDRVKRGANLELSEDFVLQVMQTIHEEAIRKQEVDRVDGAE